MLQFLRANTFLSNLILSGICGASFAGCTADTFGEQACQTDEDCPSEHRCVSSGGVLFGESLCSPLMFPLEDLDQGNPDPTGTGDMSPSPSDMYSDMPSGCEGDSTFCQRLGAQCGVLNAVDDCGVLRSVNCGECGEDETCDERNQCSCDSVSCPPQIQCGSITNACGNTAQCGSCQAASDTCTLENECCTPESDDAFCLRNGAMCGAKSAMDNCGMARIVENCGSCGSQEQCDENNACVCKPHTKEEFCDENGPDIFTGVECGVFEAEDNCGALRTEDCGACENQLLFCLEDNTCDNLWVSGPSSSQFGAQVEIEGNWLAVGAPADGGGGSVYLYDFDPSLNTWVLDTQLQHPSSSNFGRSLRRSGDKLAISSNDHILVYGQNAMNQWSLTHSIPSPTNSTVESLENDRLVVGSANATVGTLDNAGTVQVHELGSSGVFSTTEIQPPVPVTRGFFGISAALKGDKLVVGEMRNEEGKAHIFENNAGTWEFKQTLTPTDQADEGFGWHMEINDKHLTLLARRGIGQASRVYVYPVSSGVLVNQPSTFLVDEGQRMALIDDDLLVWKPGGAELFRFDDVTSSWKQEVDQRLSSGGAVPISGDVALGTDLMAISSSNGNGSTDIVHFYKTLP